MKFYMHNVFPSIFGCFFRSFKGVLSARTHAKKIRGVKHANCCKSETVKDIECKCVQVCLCARERERNSKPANILDVCMCFFLARFRSSYLLFHLKYSSVADGAN